MNQPSDLISSLKKLLTSPTVQSTIRERIDRNEGLMEFLRPLFQFLFYQYFRVDVVGAPHIPAKGGALIVSNHSGTLPYDGAMIHLAVFNHLSPPRSVYFLVDDFIFQIPLLASFIQQIGGQRASHENAMRLLDEEKLVALFPEGVRGVGKLYEERYRLQRFGRGGFVRLAMRTKRPIIPTAVIGAEEIHPLLWKSELLAKPLGLPYIPVTPTFPFLGPLGLVPLPSKWKIIFGKPISFAKTKKGDADDSALIEEKGEEIRTTIQGMINKELKKRRSIWY